MEKLQQHFSQTSARIRENRIKAAMNKKAQEPETESAASSCLEPVLPITPEQASLSISRHLAASGK